MLVPVTRARRGGPSSIYHGDPDCDVCRYWCQMGMESQCAWCQSKGCGGVRSSGGAYGLADLPRAYGIAPAIVYHRDQDGAELVLIGVSGTLGELGDLGGFWGSIGGFFKKLGVGAWKVLQVPEVHEGLIGFLQRQVGGAAASAGACVVDAECGAVYKIETASDSTVTLIPATAAQCVGSTQYQSSAIGGWVSPCGGAAAGAGLTNWTPSGGGGLPSWLPWAGILAAGLLAVVLVAKR